MALRHADRGADQDRDLGGPRADQAVAHVGVEQHGAERVLLDRRVGDRADERAPAVGLDRLVGTEQLEPAAQRQVAQPALARADPQPGEEVHLQGAEIEVDLCGLGVLHLAEQERPLERVADPLFGGHRLPRGLGAELVVAQAERACVPTGAAAGTEHDAEAARRQRLGARGRRAADREADRQAGERRQGRPQRDRGWSPPWDRSRPHQNLDVVARNVILSLVARSRRDSVRTQFHSSSYARSRSTNSRSSRSLRLTTNSRQRSWHTAVAERGASSISDISPKYAPPRSTASASSPIPGTIRLIRTAPSTIR